MTTHPSDLERARGFLQAAYVQEHGFIGEDYWSRPTNALNWQDRVAIEAIIAALRTVEEERWQPIETVDGPLERCLLWCSDVGLDGEPHGAVTGRLSRSRQRGLRAYGDGMTADWTFTHVRPLPSAPVSSLGEGK